MIKNFCSSYSCFNLNSSFLLKLDRIRPFQNFSISKLEKVFVFAASVHTKDIFFDGSQLREQNYRVSMSLFCLSFNFVYLLYFP